MLTEEAGKAPLLKPGIPTRSEPQKSDLNLQFLLHSKHFPIKSPFLGGLLGLIKLLSRL